MKFDKENQLAIGEIAPDFDLPAVDGKNYKLADFKGKCKAVVIIFWCNHCPYVIKNEKRVLDLVKEYSAQETQFFLISSNDPIRYPQDSFPEMVKRAKMKGYTAPYLFDESQTVPTAYGAKVTPHVYLLDGDFVLQYRGAIDDNLDEEKRPTVHYLKNAIDAILSGNAANINPKTTNAIGCSIKWK